MAGRKKTPEIIEAEALAPEIEHAQGEPAAEDTGFADTEEFKRIAENPLVVIQEPETFPALLAVIAKDHTALMAAADPKTRKGRAALTSFAFKVTQTKTAIDKAVTAATEVWRKNTAALNEKRREVLPQLDALAKRIKAPVDAWDAAADRRQELADAGITTMKNAGIVFITDTSETVAARLETLKATTFDAVDTEWGEPIYGDVSRKLAESAHDDAIRALEEALPRLIKSEAEAAELAQMRKEKAEREAKAEADRIAAEKAESERIAEENRQAEEKRWQDAEAERIKRAEDAAAAKARADAEAVAAQREADRIAESNRLAQESEDRHRAEMAAAQKKLDDADAERRAELDRINSERRAADAQAEADRKAEEKRQQNRAHQSRIMKAAKEAIMDLVRPFIEQGNIEGAVEAAASAVVIAAKKGEIPNITLNF